MWRKLQTPTGKDYWYNYETNERSWEIPKQVLERPIAAMKIEGTDWYLCMTSQLCHFYYHAPSKKSVWLMPSELVPVIQELTDPGSLKRKLEAEGEEEPEVAQEEELEFDIEDQDFDIDPDLNIADGPVSDEQGVLEQVQETNQQAHPPKKAQENNEQIITPELRKDFFDLLKSLNVDAFSAWELDVANMEHDPRYLAIKDVFLKRELYNEYASMQGQLEKPVEKPKTVVDIYKDLLNEKVNEKTTWEGFSKKFKRDPRFWKVEVKLRERLFHAHYKDVCENLFKLQKLKDNDFLQLLRENTWIHSNTSYHEVKEHIRRDPRFIAVDNEKSKEKLFNDYIRNELLEDIEIQRREKEAVKERHEKLKQEQLKQAREMDKGKHQIQKNEAKRVFSQLLLDHVKRHGTSLQREQRVLEMDSRYPMTDMLNYHEKQHLFEEHMRSLAKRNQTNFYQLLDETIPVLFTLDLDFSELILPKIKADIRFLRFLGIPSAEKITNQDLNYLFNMFKEYIQLRIDRLKMDFQQLLKEKSTLLEYKFIKGEGETKKPTEDENEQVFARDDEMEIRAAGLENSFGFSGMDKTKDFIVDYEDALELVEEDPRYLNMQALAEESKRMIENWIKDVSVEYKKKKFRQRG